MEKIRLEAKVDNTGLEEIIKSAGIEYPHESLGFFKTIYAELEKTNKNGVMLADSVREQVPQLVATQINFEHRRENNVCGSIIGAWVNDNNQIEVAFSFYKSIYNYEYEMALELLKENRLSVSFELMVDDSDVENLSNGVRKLHAVSFDGMGLLMSNSPACKNAIVYEQADIDKLKKQDLVFASKLEETKNEINKEEEVDKKANEALLAKQKENIISEFGEELVADWTDEDFLNEDKINALREENKAEEETKEEESAKEDKEEASEEEAKTVVKTEQVEEYDEKGEKVETKKTVEQDGEKVVETKDTHEVVYSQEDVDAIKAEYEEKLKTKEEEMATIKENAEVIAKLKVELGEFAKDFTDEDFLNEDKVTIARLRKENAELKGENTFESASEKDSKEDSEEAKEEEKPKEEVKEEKEVEEKAEAEKEEEKKAEEKKEEEPEVADEEEEESKEEMESGHKDASEEVEEEELSEEELLRLAIEDRCGKNKEK